MHWWLRNDAWSLMKHIRGALLFFKVIHRISRPHGTKKLADFDPNWVFPVCNSSLNKMNPGYFSRVANALKLHQIPNFYASAFRRRRHYVFGVVRPSVRPKPEIPAFYLYMGPLVRPSVWRGFRAFAGERMEGMAWNFTCWCILTIFRTD